MKKETLHFRKATLDDIDLYFEWVNDELVRDNSFENTLITPKEHYAWFHSKMASDTCHFYLFLNQANQPVGQVRIEKIDSEEKYNIGISIDKDFRGKSFSVNMIEMATNDFLCLHTSSTIIAFIKIDNEISHKIFKQAGFQNEEIVFVKDVKSYKLYKNLPKI